MIVIVEDNAGDQRALLEALAPLAHPVKVFVNGDLAREWCSEHDVDLLIVDLHLEEGGGRGSELLNNLRHLDKGAAYTVLVSGDGRIHGSFRRYADQVQDKRTADWVQPVARWASELFRPLPSDTDAHASLPALRPAAPGVPAGQRVYVYSSLDARFVGPDWEAHDIAGLFGLGSSKLRREDVAGSGSAICSRGRIAPIGAHITAVRLLARCLELATSSRSEHYYSELSADGLDMPPSYRSATNLSKALGDALKAVGHHELLGRLVPDTKALMASVRFYANGQERPEWTKNRSQEALVSIPPELRRRDPTYPLSRVQIVLDPREMELHEQWRSWWHRTWEVHP